MILKIKYNKHLRLIEKITKTLYIIQCFRIFKDDFGFKLYILTYILKIITYNIKLMINMIILFNNPNLKTTIIKIYKNLKKNSLPRNYFIY